MFTSVFVFVHDALPPIPTQPLNKAVCEGVNATCQCNSSKKPNELIQLKLGEKLLMCDDIRKKGFKTLIY